MYWVLPGYFSAHTPLTPVNRVSQLHLDPWPGATTLVNNNVPGSKHQTPPDQVAGAPTLKLA
jgi:hypothetical protein